MPWQVGDALAVFGLVLAGLLAFVVVQAVAATTAAPTRPLRLAGLYVIGLLTLLATIGWVRVRYGRAVRLLRGRPHEGVRDVLGSVGLGLLGLLVMFVFVLGIGLVLQLLLGEVPTLQEGYEQLATQPTFVPYLVGSAVVVAPIAEEVYFRGMLYPALRDRLGTWPGILVTSLAFSAVHVVTASGGLATVILLVAVIFPLGIVLAGLYQRYGTLLVPIVAHMTFNAWQVTSMIVRANA